MARYCSIFVFSVTAIMYYLVIAHILQMTGLSAQAHSVSLENVAAALCAVIFINSVYFPVFLNLDIFTLDWWALFYFLAHLRLHQHFLNKLIIRWCKM